MKATKLLSDRKVHQDALAAAAAESAEHLLQVKGLKCGYGKKNPVEIVHGVDFCVDKGEFLCVIGSNGCGKTTTMKAVMGLLPAMAGQVLISGQDVHVMNEKEKARTRSAPSCSSIISAAFTERISFAGTAIKTQSSRLFAVISL